ncbi:MAG: hypothetical protein IPK66_05425 [Rhodospirillales bacterium]|nr:hypothetical protein [Rhodospirillales bacterium]
MSHLTFSRLRHSVLVKGLSERAQLLASSRHFSIFAMIDVEASGQCAADAAGDDIIVVHDFTRDQIDNNIGSYVANELLPLIAALRRANGCDEYGFGEHETFERYVGEIVRSIDGSERRAWHLYYDNTLAALRAPALANGGNETPDFIGDFSAIYRRAAELAAEVGPTTLLDAATCFGFLPLLLASNGAQAGNHDRPPRRITACDLNPALVALADDYARARAMADVSFLRVDVLADDIEGEFAPLAPAFEVVTAVHLLEHLDAEQTPRAIDNLWQLTRRRLIIAVPLEAAPDARFGHRQVFDEERLSALGERTGGSCRFFEDHGGWLVVDRSGHQN